MHATDPELRAKLIGNPRGREIMDILRRFAAAGIFMECQIVAVPGWNDGAALQRSLEDLAGLYPHVSSVSIVPVGLTCHREKLTPLSPYTPEQARATIAQVESFAAECFEKYGSHIFYCSDEMYLRAGLPLPEDEYYEDYAQLENGVGMLRLLETEFALALSLEDEADPGRKRRASPLRPARPPSRICARFWKRPEQTARSTAFRTTSSAIQSRSPAAHRAGHHPPSPE